MFLQCTCSWCAIMRCHQQKATRNAISQNACISQGASTVATAAPQCHIRVYQLAGLWKFRDANNKWWSRENGKGGREWELEWRQGCHFQFRAHFTQIIEISFFLLSCCCCYCNCCLSHLLSFIDTNRKRIWHKCRPTSSLLQLPHRSLSCKQNLGYE